MTLVTSSVEYDRLGADFDLDALGLSLVAAPWYEPDAHRRRVEEMLGEVGASDVSGLGLDATFELTRSRLGLCSAEIDVMTGLARVAADAVENVLAEWRPGATSDREIAADVARELELQGAEAVCLIVGGDERLRRFRHPVLRGDVLERSAMVVVVARSLGLHVALTRLASVDDEVSASSMQECETVHERVRDATKVGATWGDVYSALARAYREVGHPDAWREHFQGGPIGYGQREFELSPTSTSSPWWCEPIPAGCASAFNPSLAGGAKIEDTYLVGADAPVPLTSTPSWSRLAGDASGADVLRLREKRAT
jgi:antitoxin VapB